MKMLYAFQALIKISIFLLYLSYNNVFAENLSIPLVWNVPSSNDFFTGRQEELEKITAILNSSHKVLINGPAGVGKTQLAKKYANIHHDKYNVIWWFDTDKNLDDQLMNLAYQLYKNNIDSKQIDLDQVSTSALLLYIKDTLRTTDKSWLIIFDNAKNIELIKEYIPETHNHLHKNIIITSRNSNLAFPSLNLKIFSRKEAIDFLLNATNASNSDEVAKLANLLAYYPIALAQAASCIKANNMKIFDYITLYNKDPRHLWHIEKKILSSDNNYFDLNKNTIETSIKLNLTNIKNESNLAAEILDVISLMKVALIPEYLLKDIVMANHNILDEDYNSAIRVLKQYSLIEEQQKENKKYFQTHDLIKTLVRQELITSSEKKIFGIVINNSSKVKTLYKNILAVLCTYLDKPWGEMITYINNNTELINIATNIAQAANHEQIKDIELIRLITCLLEHNNMIFHMKSNYILYQEITEIGFKFIENFNGTVPLILRARFYFNAIYADVIYNSPKSAVLYEEKLKVLISEIQDTQSLPIDISFLTFINMAKFSIIRGDISQGMYYIDKAYSLLNEISTNTYLAEFWYSITWLYLEQGDYIKANESLQNFFKITENKKNYPIHLYAMNMRGTINFHLNNFKEAYCWADKCYKESEKFYQSDISNISAEALITISRYYKAAKKYDLAIVTINKAIKTLNIIFGADDIDSSQALAHTLRGEIYEEKKDYKNAYREYKFAEKYYDKVYKDSLIDTYEVSNLYANLAILGLRINDSGLTKQYLELLIKNFSLQNKNIERVLDLMDEMGKEL